MLTTLNASLLILNRITKEELFRFCSVNPDLQIERNKHGSVLFMSPFRSETDIFGLVLRTVTELWDQTRKYTKIFSPRAGFMLPDRSVKSANVAWISKGR